MKNMILVLMSTFLISCSGSDEMMVNVESLINLNSVMYYEGKPFSGIAFANSTTKGKVKPRWGYYFQEGKKTGTVVYYDEIETKGGFFVSRKHESFEDYTLVTEYYPNGDKKGQGKFTDTGGLFGAGKKGYPNSDLLFWSPNGEKILVGVYDKDGELVRKITVEEMDKLMEGFETDEK